MFERRLKLFLAILLIISGGLALRAGQIQWLEHDSWVAQAQKHLKKTDSLDTTRGAILDRNGNQLAVDEPCVDAVVDYPAITETPDPEYVTEHAKINLTARLGEQWTKDPNKAKLLADECTQVRQDIADMWTELANCPGEDAGQIEEKRQEIVARVEMQRRSIGYHSFLATTRQTSGSWYRKLLDEAPAISTGGDLAIARQPYIVLPNIDADTQARLARQHDRFFALNLVPGKFRYYPRGTVACHVIGFLGQVGDEQIEFNDAYGYDKLKYYKPGDLIGRSGLEALCERALRGTRGEEDFISGIDDPQQTIPAIPGKDVRSTIDVDLLADVEAAFVKTRTYHLKSDGTTEVRGDLHGAAVVIDLATGEVLAMASNPGYDLNTLDDDYSALAMDDLNSPLLNRATQMAEEPGSTIKTIVGSGAITHNIWSPTDTVVCKGELVIDGKPQPFGHCWTWALYKSGQISSPSHNAVAGDNALPDDRLTIADGLERSCNVCFETIADHMGLFELSYWFDQFGLGRPTGIGIDEVPGLIPHVSKDDHSPALRSRSWSVGIGEGDVKATPLQMANVAATIARGGIWIRPHLVDPADIGSASTRPDPDLGPDVVDLHLSPAAVQTVQSGMYRVVNSLDGSGRGILPINQEPQMSDDPLSLIHIAGKTGTAQSHILTIPKRDPQTGEILHDAQGNEIHVPVEVGAAGTELWYHTSDNNYDHAWFIGYAPAEHPQVAFCVMVQFGEAGGRVAGSIAHDVLEACVQHHYLSIPKQSNDQTLAQ